MIPLLVVAGFMGACGIALGAASAHAATEIKLEPAGYLLVIHAVAVVAGAAAVDRGLLWRPLGIAALVGFALGSALFAGDLALRAVAGHRLFPMAAPSGGMILIASWILLAGAAAVAGARS